MNQISVCSRCGKGSDAAVVPFVNRSDGCLLVVFTRTLVLDTLSSLPHAEHVHADWAQGFDKGLPKALVPLQAGHGRN
jgi:hypothetical protein